ncbi:MAG: thioredoxin [Longimicrobiales bacterium]
MSKATIPCSFCGTLNRIDLELLASGPKCAQCARPFALDRPLKLADADFDRVVADAGVPLLVDFYADWCGPCKVMAPILDDIARARQGSLLVAKVDTDRNPATSAGHVIRGIPTLVLFRSGREAGRQVGAAPRAVIESLIDGPGGSIKT